jgi:hypothetical protein
MSRRFIRRYAAQLELSSMDDTELDTLAGEIAFAAKSSDLVAQSAAAQASVAAIAAKCITYTTARKLVADDRVKLRADMTDAAVARTDFVGEIRTYASLISNRAKMPTELETAGLPLRGPRPSRGALPTVPERIDVKIPRRGHGKIVVSVHETGSTKHAYVAEQSPDGITWAQLGVGRGKTRVVTGASGTTVWVRFAMVRGELQSAWSMPFQVGIP